MAFIRTVDQNPRRLLETWRLSTAYITIGWASSWINPLGPGPPWWEFPTSEATQGELQGEYERKLEASDKSFQRHILGVRWYDFVPNTVITQHTGQGSLISSVCITFSLVIFGHI